MMMMTGTQIKLSTLLDRIRERRPEQSGLQFSAEDGKRRCVLTSERVAVEHSNPRLETKHY